VLSPGDVPRALDEALDDLVVGLSAAHRHAGIS
jgi:hypothetical protein